MSIRALKTLQRCAGTVQCMKVPTLDANFILRNTKTTSATVKVRLKYLIRLFFVLRAFCVQWCIELRHVWRVGLEEAIKGVLGIFVLFFWC